MDVRKSYLGNYLRVYLWQCLSIATSFLSMFVVLPQLSSRPAMFGIYSICLSITIFASYADFGFLNSGFRYAAESFVKGDLKKETQTIGFVSFILLVFMMLHALVVSVLAVHPTLLIGNLTDPRESWTASMLLATLAVFSPVIVLQRMLQIVFGVRIEDYIYQRFNIVANLLKVGSVFLFFDRAGYNIVGYFLTCQLIGLLFSLVSLVIARRRYRYDLGLLLRSVRFSAEIYRATRRLAFSSLYVTLGWVAYYEFDTLFIGKTLGAERLAFYSVALTLTTFFRSISSVIFAPFRARINHFVALKDDERVRALYQRVMVVTMPVVLFPIISLEVLMKPFIFCWVGGNYLTSVLIAQMLIVAYADGFSSNPANYLLVAQSRVRELNVLGSLSPIILWGGVLLTFRMLDVTTFGFLKFLAAVPVQIITMVISMRCLKLGAARFFGRVIGPVILPSLCLVAMLLCMRGLLPVSKSQVNVAVVIVTGGVGSLLALLLYFWLSTAFRAEVRNLAAGWGSLRRQAVVEGA